MRVQLQTNHANRNFAQKVNKTQVCVKPNFTGSGQVTIPMGKECNLVLLKCFEAIFREHIPTAIIEEGRDLVNRVYYIKASFERAKDAAMVKALLDEEEKLSRNGITDIEWTYTTRYNGLNEESLRRVNLYPQQKSLAEIVEEQGQTVFPDGYIQ